ncbi:MAG: hypothetical protein NVSMB52_17330 [Chloroflexota bacterium]
MPGRAGAVLLSTVLGLTILSQSALSTVSAHWQRSQTDAKTLLRLSDRSMQSVHSVHAVGWHTSADAAAHLDVRIVGDCYSRWQGSIPIQAQTSVTGTYLEAHRPVRRINRSYLAIGDVSGAGIGHSWERPLDHPTPWIAMHEPFDTVLYVSYVHDVCLALFRGPLLTDLRDSRNSSVQRFNLGRQVLQGRTVWHVREVTGFTLDFFIDAQSYLLRRLVLSGNLGTTWRERFDYSGFNEVLHIQAPPSSGK